VVEKLAEKKKDIDWITDPKFHQSHFHVSLLFASKAKTLLAGMANRFPSKINGFVKKSYFVLTSQFFLIF
jgi:hypothetical protein